MISSNVFFGKLKIACLFEERKTFIGGPAISFFQNLALLNNLTVDQNRPSESEINTILIEHHKKVFRNDFLKSNILH